MTESIDKDRNESIRQFEANLWWKLKCDSLNSAKEYGQSAIKNLTLINGGASLALLSFLATFLNRPNISDKIDACILSITLSCFLLGLLTSTIAAGIGYINFSIIEMHLPGPNELHKYISHGDVDGWTESGALVNITAWSGIVCTILSAICFAIGSGFSAYMIYKMAL